MPLCIRCACDNWIPAIGGPCPYCQRVMTKEDLKDRQRVRRFRRCAWIKITNEQDKKEETK